MIESCGVLVVVLRITCFSEFMLLSCSRVGSSVAAPLDLRVEDRHSSSGGLRSLTPSRERPGDRVGHRAPVWRSRRQATAGALLVDEEDSAVRREAAAAELRVACNRPGEVIYLPVRGEPAHELFVLA